MGSVHSQIGLLIRLRAAAHHRGSQGFWYVAAPEVPRTHTLPRRLRRHYIASRAAHRCGQSPPLNRLAILCIRPVSVAAASAGSGQAGVDIRPPHRLAALWI
ncbi:hypothetical protein BVI2075_1160008 [Burkholderia vietnamiensis]|nr:hypothetical protein BVI2075_1160008 [Burkholderia vietnamiensis]